MRDRLALGYACEKLKATQLHLVTAIYRSKKLLICFFSSTLLILLIMDNEWQSLCHRLHVTPSVHPGRNNNVRSSQHLLRSCLGEANEIHLSINIIGFKGNFVSALGLINVQENAI